MSLAYHFCDIFLDEVNRTLVPLPTEDAQAEEPADPLPAPINLLLAPFCHALAQARPGTAIFKRIVDSVLDPLFENIEVHTLNGTYQPSSVTISIFPTFATSICVNPVSNDSESFSELAVVRSHLLRMLFEAGAHKDCLEANRKKLYAYWASRGGVNEDD